MKCFALALVTAGFLATTKGDEAIDSQENQERGQRSISEAYDHHVAIPAPQLISQHVDVEKHVPVVQYTGVPVPVPHHVPVPHPVPVPVPHPVPVQVPVHVPVYRTVTVPVEKPVPYPVEKHVPYEVIRKIHVAVPKPYPVPVPVYRTKHVFHEIIHSKHGW